MITRIEANRYRCLKNLGIDIPRYAVLVGANGSGKTTLLDVPRLIGDCLSQRDITQAFTQRQRGRPARCTALSELVYCGQGDAFILVLESRLPEQVIPPIVEALPASQKVEPRWPSTIRYELRLEIFNERQVQVKNEYLYLFSDRAVPSRDGARLNGETSPHRDWRFIIRREYGGETQFRAEGQKGAKSRSTKIEPNMLALSRLLFESRDDFPAAIWFHDLLAQDYLFYQPDPDALQAASPPGLSDRLMSSAANLPLPEHRGRLMSA
ncbi:MAG: hypothetical protein VBE63_14775 [Lamprobacter sp.]|uniref:AAA family ATPase n=1 Tax=Lamprobacter sp. TaxID=3100796 RepID=UPI002B260F78|nr:hypothetical protein [Lamprobacter sp.]MEA3641186.1 hypothetical protein [Lamprobacter sp.]